MAKKDNWTVCDLTGIILDDGVTISPNHVTIDDGVMYTHTSEDPMNELARYKPFILHNRVKYRQVTGKPCKNKKLQGKAFITEAATRDYLTRQGK